MILPLSNSDQQALIDNEFSHLGEYHWWLLSVSNGAFISGENKKFTGKQLPSIYIGK